MITDARHDSTSNAYHTTVPCLSGRYILYRNNFTLLLLTVYMYYLSQYQEGGGYISTVSRKEHASAQTHEVECPKRVLPEVIKCGEYLTVLYNYCNLAQYTPK